MDFDIGTSLLVVSLESVDLSLYVLELALTILIEFFSEEGLSHNVVEFIT